MVFAGSPFFVSVLLRGFNHFFVFHRRHPGDLLEFTIEVSNIDISNLFGDFNHFMLCFPEQPLGFADAQRMDVFRKIKAGIPLKQTAEMKRTDKKTGGYPFHRKGMRKIGVAEFNDLRNFRMESHMGSFRVFFQFTGSKQQQLNEQRFAV